MVLRLEDSIPEHGGTLIDLAILDFEEGTSFEPLMRILTMCTCRRHSIPTMTGQRYLFYWLDNSTVLRGRLCTVIEVSRPPLLADSPCIIAGQSRDCRCWRPSSGGTFKSMLVVL